MKLLAVFLIVALASSAQANPASPQLLNLVTNVVGSLVNLTNTIVPVVNNVTNTTTGLLTNVVGTVFNFTTTLPAIIAANVKTAITTANSTFTGTTSLFANLATYVKPVITSFGTEFTKFRTESIAASKALLDSAYTSFMSTSNNFTLSALNLTLMVNSEVVEALAGWYNTIGSSDIAQFLNFALADLSEASSMDYYYFLRNLTAGYIQNGTLNTRINGCISRNLTILANLNKDAYANLTKAAINPYTNFTALAKPIHTAIVGNFTVLKNDITNCNNIYKLNVTTGLACLDNLTSFYPPIFDNYTQLWQSEVENVLNISFVNISAVASAIRANLTASRPILRNAVLGCFVAP